MASRCATFPATPSDCRRAGRHPKQLPPLLRRDDPRDRGSRTWAPCEGAPPDAPTAPNRRSVDPQLRRRRVRRCGETYLCWTLVWCGGPFDRMGWIFPAFFVGPPLLLVGAGTLWRHAPHAVSGGGPIAAVAAVINPVMLLIPVRMCCRRCDGRMRATEVLAVAKPPAGAWRASTAGSAATRCKDPNRTCGRTKAAVIRILTETGRTALRPPPGWSA